jgi:hypothetical protein
VNQISFIHVEEFLFADVLKNLPASWELLHGGKIENMISDGVIAITVMLNIVYLVLPIYLNQSFECFYVFVYKRDGCVLYVV